jgi:hypothetical protein
MTPLTSLWLPILLSALGVFLVSSVLHMLTPWHKGDFRRLANEDQVRQALRPLALEPGDYMVPRPATREEMSSPEFARKMVEGPVLVMTVIPSGPPNMGANLLQWFAYAMVVGALAAYVAGRALGPGAPAAAVLRFAGTTAFIGYAAALWQSSIWYRRSWWTTLKLNVDGLVYGVLTGLVFAWLWPR